MKRLLLLFALASPAFPQFFPKQVRFVATNPSGACGASYITQNTVTGLFTGCLGGTWTSLGAFGSISLTGKVTTYNNIATVAGGAPSILAVADLTAQSAAKTATALYTPTATGLYRISYYAKVTTAATTSSILGGTTGLILAYTDGTDSVAQTAFTLPEDNQAGSALSVGTGNTTNTTQAVVHGTAVIYALTGVGITYAFGYTSVGVTAMQYELHITLEAL